MREKQNGFMYVLYSKNCKPNVHFDEFLKSYRSLKKNLPNFCVSLYTNINPTLLEVDEKLDVIYDENLPSTYIAKAFALLNTPYKKTIFLDTDIVLHCGNIKTIFEILTNEIILASSYDNAFRNLNSHNFNTGIVAIKKCKKSDEYLKWWIDECIKDNYSPDQITFEKIVERSRNEGTFYVLSPELQFRPNILLNQIKNPISTHFSRNHSISHKNAVKWLYKEIGKYYQSLQEDGSLYNFVDIIRFNQKRGLKFKGTLAEEYLRKNDTDELNFKLLQKLVKSRSKPPERDTISIHIRLGDILCLQKFSNDIPSYCEIIKKYGLHKKYKNCSLYYGNHKTGDRAMDQQSNKIIKRQVIELEQLGLNTKVVSNSPDEDFVALSTCLCYVVGIKGFSWLSASINQNEVFWDAQDVPNFSWLLNSKYKEQMLRGYKYQTENKF